MIEEDMIRKNYGSGNPFKVPEGYFQQFADNLMSKLPDVESKSKSVLPVHRKFSFRRSVWYSAAAVVCGIMAFGTYYFGLSRTSQSSAYFAETTVAESVYIDDVLDYAMVSNHEIVQYLTEVY